MGYDETQKDDDSWWEERSLPVKIIMGIGFGILGILFLSLIGFVFMWLWNGLMPEIFNLPRISYWQGWGLMILSQILFKNWGSSSSDSGSSKKRKRHIRRIIRDEIAAEIEKEIDKELEKEKAKDGEVDTQGESEQKE
jgi:hypothetical protein